MNSPNVPRRRLLALDGGGLMGIISLGILQRIEDQLRTAFGGDPDFRLRDFFDYVAGTSTGAIIAAGIMRGMRVSDLRALYLDNGKEMFSPASRYTKVEQALRGRKFLHEPLSDRLKQVLGTGSIHDMQQNGDLPTDRHLMMVMHKINSDSPWYISTNPAAHYNQPGHKQCNLKLPLWQLVRASTAAPGYFFPEACELVPGDPQSTVVFQDGGVTPHNNPALKLFQMATQPAFKLNWHTGEENMMLISIGTGILPKIVKTPRIEGISGLKLAATAPTWLMNGASAENDLMCRMLGRCVHGAKIDNEVGDLIPVEPTNRAFTYARYDADLSTASLATMGIAAKPTDLVMDNVQMMSVFVKIGQAAAEQVDLNAQFANFIK